MDAVLKTYWLKAHTQVSKRDKYARLAQYGSQFLAHTLADSSTKETITQLKNIKSVRKKEHWKPSKAAPHFPNVTRTQRLWV